MVCYPFMADQRERNTLWGRGRQFSWLWGFHQAVRVGQKHPGAKTLKAKAGRPDHTSLGMACCHSVWLVVRCTEGWVPRQGIVLVQVALGSHGVFLSRERGVSRPRYSSH